MADLDLVEKLRARANVTYDEAKEALEACNDDLLDAVIYLERKGKVPPPSGGGQYTSKESREGEREYAAYKATRKPPGKTFSDHMRDFGAKLEILIKKSWASQFQTRRHGAVAFQMPLLVFLLLLCGGFHIVVPLLIFGLFFGFRYKIEGADSTAGTTASTKTTGTPVPPVPPVPPVNDRINEIIEEVANAADVLQGEITMNTTPKE